MIDHSKSFVTPEQQAAFRERFLHDVQRRGWPIAVEQSSEGFTASRDGLTGRGQTRDEAVHDLFKIEGRWVVDPTGFLHDLLEGKIDPNTLKPI